MSQCFQLAVALSTNAASILIFRFLGGTFAAAPLANSGYGFWWLYFTQNVDSLSTVLLFRIYGMHKCEGKHYRSSRLLHLQAQPSRLLFLDTSLLVVYHGDGCFGFWPYLWTLFLCNRDLLLRSSFSDWNLLATRHICHTWNLSVSRTPFLLIWQCLNTKPRPILLVQKAQRKRKETGDARFFAPLEKETFTILQQVKHVLALPFKILFHEPMLIAITVYMSVRTNSHGLRYHYWYWHISSSMDVSTSFSKHTR